MTTHGIRARTRAAGLLMVIMVAPTVWGCGGGRPPEELRSAKVLVPLGTMTKTLVYEDQRLGLLQGMAQVPGSDRIALFGHAGNCVLVRSENPATCEPTPSGIAPPVSIGTFVSAEYISADFDGDGTPERIKPIPKAGFVLESATGDELARTHLERYWVGTEFGYWFEPAVTWSSPRFLLVSTDGALLLFDSRLREYRTLPTPGMQSPLHVSAGAPLDGVGTGAFATVFGGRGGWHRSILFVHSASNQVVYEEILGDDFMALWPLPVADGQYRFLLGGRGQVWEYSFTLPGA